MVIRFSTIPSSSQFCPTSCTAKPYKRFSTSGALRKMKPWNHTPPKNENTRWISNVSQHFVLGHWISKGIHLFVFSGTCEDNLFLPKIDNSPGLGSIRIVRITKQRWGESGTRKEKNKRNGSFSIFPWNPGHTSNSRENPATSSLIEICCWTPFHWQPDPLQQGCEDWSL